MGLYQPNFTNDKIENYVNNLINSMKKTPLTDNVFDALEKYGQCALTGPSGPVQGIANPS